MRRSLLVRFDCTDRSFRCSVVPLHRKLRSRRVEEHQLHRRPSPLDCRNGRRICDRDRRGLAKSIIVSSSTISHRLGSGSSRRCARADWRVYDGCYCIARNELGLGRLVGSPISCIRANDEFVASRGLSNGSTASTNIPSQPSSFILASLRSLSNSIRQLGPHRTLSDPTFVPSLLIEYRSKCAVVVRTVLGELEAEDESEERSNKSLQGSWDMRFLGRFWDADEEWGALCERMMVLVSILVVAAIRETDFVL